MEKTTDEIFEAFWIILKKKIEQGVQLQQCRCCVKAAFEIALVPYLKERNADDLGK